MLTNKYCILSFPNKEKHYVLRTSESEDEIMMRIDGMFISSSLISINDSYEEAQEVLKNLKG